jgi:hypothetical protein
MTLTTNKPWNERGKVLHDEDLAAAILDRVLETRHLRMESSPFRVELSKYNSRLYLCPSTVVAAFPLISGSADGRSPGRMVDLAASGRIFLCVPVPFHGCGGTSVDFRVVLTVVPRSDR